MIRKEENNKDIEIGLEEDYYKKINSSFIVNSL